MSHSFRGVFGTGIRMGIRPQHALNALVSPNLAKALSVRVPGNMGLSLQADHGGHKRPLLGFTELLVCMQVSLLPMFLNCLSLSVAKMRCKVCM
jgi:hypothetical protein